VKSVSRVTTLGGVNLLREMLVSPTILR
jgi:hypothetical protein